MTLVWKSAVYCARVTGAMATARATTPMAAIRFTSGLDAQFITHAASRASVLWSGGPLIRSTHWLSHNDTFAGRGRRRVVELVWFFDKGTEIRSQKPMHN